MLALIDNYDSFTYNLVQYLGELGADIRVFRNDKISLDELIALKPDQLVVSPGPGEPLKDGGVSPEAIKHFTGKIPVLGVCLGHQCIGAVYGGKVDRAPRLMHGKTSPVTHNGQGVFKDIPSPFEAMRYHSLVVYEPIPSELEIVAQTSEGEIMALKHRQHPTYGVQFHPESILTEHGKQLLKNFLDIKITPPAGASTEPSMLKPFIAKAINAFLEPIREKRAYYLAHPTIPRDVLANGIRRMQAEAKQTMELVRDATGLSYSLDLFADEVDIFGNEE